MSKYVGLHSLFYIEIDRVKELNCEVNKLCLKASLGDRVSELEKFAIEILKENNLLEGSNE
jgi:hypothetical protein